jgi:two-component system chemotaxis response regulator CheB
MTQRDIVVIGASAGGVETLRQLVRTLPQNLRASVFVTVHFPPNAPSALPRILSREGTLQAAHAVHGDVIRPNRIYVAPPNQHLLIEHGAIALSDGPKEHHNRPAIDPMFRSAARAFGPRVIGVVLSGTLDDGAAGLRAVKDAGGVAIVQNPETALFSAMPEAALKHAGADRVLPISEIGNAIVELTAERIGPGESPTIGADTRNTLGARG